MQGLYIRRIVDLCLTAERVRNVSYKAYVVWGHPADQICRFASESDADLIVIGSHGRTGISRAILGSVSHAVANQAPCPVTIVR